MILWYIIPYISPPGRILDYQSSERVCLVMLGWPSAQVPRRGCSRSWADNTLARYSNTYHVGYGFLASPLPGPIVVSQIIPYITTPLRSLDCSSYWDVVLQTSSHRGLHHDCTAKWDFLKMILGTTFHHFSRLSLGVGRGPPILRNSTITTPNSMFDARSCSRKTLPGPAAPARIAVRQQEPVE